MKITTKISIIRIFLTTLGILTVAIIFYVSRWRKSEFIRFYVQSFDGLSKYLAEHRQPPKWLAGRTADNPIDVPLSEILAINTPPDPPPFEPKGTRIYDDLKDCWGTLHVSIVVSPDGDIVQTRYLDGGAWPMGSEASQYARNWRFVPYYMNGKPQFVRTIVTLNYKNPGGLEPRGLHYSNPIDLPLGQIKLISTPTAENWANTGNEPCFKTFHGEFEASVTFDPWGHAIGVEDLKINSILFKSRGGTYYPGDNVDKGKDVAMVAFHAGSFMKRNQCEPFVVGKYPRYIRTTLKIRV